MRDLIKPERLAGDSTEVRSGVFDIWTIVDGGQRCLITGLTHDLATRLIRRLNDVYGDTQAWAEED